MFVGEGMADTLLSAPNSSYRNNAWLGGATPHIEEEEPFISDTEPQVKIEETETGVDLVITLSEKTASHTVPVLDRDAINLTFGFDPAVTTDFFGNARNASVNAAGALSKLKPGENRIRIHTYSELYLKALELIGK